MHSKATLDGSETFGSRPELFQTCRFFSQLFDAATIPTINSSIDLEKSSQKRSSEAIVDLQRLVSVFLHCIVYQPTIFNFRFI
jgi:hypothetical protein